MTDRSLVAPSLSYDPQHERLRNRRIEEVMRRNATNVSDQLRAIFIPVCLVSELPTAVAGVRGFVTDASSATFNDPVVGGGASAVPVFHNGSSWRVG